MFRFGARAGKTRAPIVRIAPVRISVRGASFPPAGHAQAQGGTPATGCSLKHLFDKSRPKATKTRPKTKPRENARET
ncbi:hypothetical protein [Dokdonella ginsengisoli]|uniref:Uncharacterized protein n=1 Tax=Dokdonella ginsengisoli TaxID=363846 RepID=A0ABV9QPX1_9GAMM